MIRNVIPHSRVAATDGEGAEMAEARAADGSDSAEGAAAATALRDGKSSRTERLPSTAAPAQASITAGTPRYHSTQSRLDSKYWRSPSTGRPSSRCSDATCLATAWSVWPRTVWKYGRSK